MKRTLQALLMAPEWHSDCVVGMKNSTVREGIRDYQEGQCVLCCHIASWCMMVEVKEVTHCKLWQVDEAIAKGEGFGGKQQLLEKLQEYYPNISWDSYVTVVEWV